MSNSSNDDTTKSANVLGFWHQREIANKHSHDLNHHPEPHDALGFWHKQERIGQHPVFGSQTPANHLRKQETSGQHPVSGCCSLGDQPAHLAHQGNSMTPEQHANMEKALIRDTAKVQSQLKQQENSRPQNSIPVAGGNAWVDVPEAQPPNHRSSTTRITQIATPKPEILTAHEVDNRVESYLGMLHDSTITQVQQAGDRTLQAYENGVRVQIDPSISIIAFPDGTQFEKHNDGTKIHTYSDGTNWVKFPDGTVQETLKDGSKVQTNPMGDTILDPGATDAKFGLKKAATTMDVIPLGIV